jgi:hypothetical protein
MTNVDYHEMTNQKPLNPFRPTEDVRLTPSVTKLTTLIVAYH